MPLLVAATTFVTAFFPVRADNDFWWHVKTGQYLLRTGDWFPPHEPFSVTGADKPYVNHEWLSDLILATIYDRVGVFGCVLLNAGYLSLVYLAFYFYLLSRCDNRVIAALVAIMAVQVGQFTMYVRPPVVTYGMLVLYLFILERIRARPQPHWLLLLAALMCVWANLHGGAILGLILYGAYLFEVLVRRRVFAHGGPFGEVAYWLIGLPVIIIASLCNPWGLGVYELTFKVMNDPWLPYYIDELQRPNFAHAWMYLVMVALTASALVLLGAEYCGLLVAGRGRIHLGEVMFTLFLLWQSWNHVRHLPLFGLASAAIVAVGLRAALEHLQRLQWNPPSFPLLLIRALCVLIAGYSLLVGLLYRAIPCVEHRGLVAEAFPVEACEMIKEASLPPPLFHPINCAGYLIYALSPEVMQTYSDSRFDIHGSHALVEVLLVFDEKRERTLREFLEKTDHPVVERVLRILDPPPDANPDQTVWRYILDKHGFNTVLAYDDSELVPRIESDPDWVRVYFRRGSYMPPSRRPWVLQLTQAIWGQYSFWRLPGFVLYVRNTPENGAAIARAREIMARYLRERAPYSDL